MREKPQGRGCYENLQNLGFLLIENVSKIRYIALHILAILGARVCENQAFLARSFSVLQYDDDSIENITKKVNLRPFKLYRVYLEPLNSLNVGDISWS